MLGRPEFDPTNIAETNTEIRSILEEVRPDESGEYGLEVNSLSYYNRPIMNLIDDIPQVLLYMEGPDAIDSFSHAIARGRVRIKQLDRSPIYVARLEVDALFDGPAERRSLMHLVPTAALSPYPHFIIGTNQTDTLYTLDIQAQGWSVHLAKRAPRT